MSYILYNNNQYSNLLYRKISFDAISNSYSATINLCSAISNALTDMRNINLWITSIEMVKVSLGRSHEY